MPIWKTVSPFMAARKFYAGRNVLLNENQNTIYTYRKSQKHVATSFISPLIEFGNNESVISVSQAINEYYFHSNIIKRNLIILISIVF